MHKLSSGGYPILLDADDLAFEQGFRFTRHEAVGLIFELYLNETGADLLRDAITDAEGGSLRRAFLQLVVDGNAVGSYGVSPELVDAIRDGSWNRRLRLAIGTEEKSRAVVEYSGMPKVPFDFRVDT